MVKTKSNKIHMAVKGIDKATPLVQKARDKIVWFIFEKDGESPLCGVYQKGDRKRLFRSTAELWEKAGIGKIEEEESDNG